MLRQQSRNRISKTFLVLHREKAPSNKTLWFSKSMNMDIWIVGTSNQHFLRGSSTEKKIRKNEVVTHFFHKQRLF